MRKSDVQPCQVIRNGLTSSISMEELVVGDVIVIEPGKTVPADCLLIQSEEIQVDESVITGESDYVYKEALTPENYQHNPAPFLLQSTTVVEGEGRAIVLAVGEYTQSGKAERTLNIQDDLTPL